MVAAETNMAKGMNRARGHVSLTFLIWPMLNTGVKHSLKSLVNRIP